jgi:hypothetical protein
MPGYVHNGYTRYLADSSLEVLIVGCHYIAPVLLDSINKAVISIGSLVRAMKPLEARVLCQPKENLIHLTFEYLLQSETEFLSHFL